jgi:sugar phosphate isomerase/epimerase
MFELAVFADDIDQDLPHALDVIQELGLRWLEIRSAWGKNLADQPEEKVQEVCRAIRERGLRVRCVAAPLFKCHLGKMGTAAAETHHAAPRDEAAEMEVLRRAIRTARALDTTLIRCFSFWRIEGDPAAFGPALRQRFLEAIALAGQEGMTLVMENDYECNLGTGAEAAGLLGEMASPTLRALWDPGNAYFAGEVPFPDGYERVKHLIGHVHLKDAVRDPASGKARWVALGTGEVDLLGQLQALAEDGYRDVVTMENHYVPPGGRPEDGVRESLRGLRRLLEQMR